LEKGRNNLRKYLIYIIILVVIYAVPLLMQNTNYAFLISIFTLMAIFGTVIIGYDLLKGYGGVFSVAQFAFFGIGAYCSALVTVKYHLPPILGVAIGVAVTLILAFILGYLTLKLQFLYLGIATLAFGEIFYRFLVGFSEITGGAVGIQVPCFSLFGLKVADDVQSYYLNWSITVVGFILGINLLRSGWGRALIAQNSDQVAAGCMGINVARIRIQVFLISAVYASIAGSFYAHFQNFVVPGQFTLALAIDLILMLFMGGIRTLWGGLIGVAIIQILPEILESLRDYRPFISGLLLVLIMLFMPRGIAGTLTELWEDWFGSSQSSSLEGKKE
jgi:branched-chain amino acid transport system permease protein